MTDKNTNELRDLKKKYNKAMNDNGVLAEELDKAKARIEELQMQYNSAYAVSLDTKASLIAVREREEAKHAKIVTMNALAEIDKNTIRVLSKKIQSLIEGIVLRGRIRSKHDIPYGLVRKYILAGHDATKELVLKVCEEHDDMFLEPVISIVEEIREKEFNKEEREEMVKRYRKILVSRPRRMGHFNGNNITINADAQVKDVYRYNVEIKEEGVGK